MSTVQLAIRRACDDPTVKTPANLARLLSRATGRHVSPSMVQQWVDGRRPVAPHYGPAIKRITEGRVQLWDLRPQDWHLIWPSEIGTEGAPVVAGAGNDAQVREAA